MQLSSQRNKENGEKPWSLWRSLKEDVWGCKENERETVKEGIVNGGNYGRTKSEIQANWCRKSNWDY